MDLSALDTTTKAGQGATLHLLHPSEGIELYSDSDPITGERPTPKKGEKLPEGIPITITAYGADSKIFKKLQSDTRRENDKRKTDISLEEAEGMINKHLALIITRWTGIELNNEPLPLSVENALKVFEVWPWAKEQLSVFVSDRANFLPGA